MNLDLTEEETAALLRELDGTDGVQRVETRSRRTSMSEPAKLFEEPLVSGDWCVEREDDDGKGRIHCPTKSRDRWPRREDGSFLRLALACWSCSKKAVSVLGAGCERRQDA